VRREKSQLLGLVSPASMVPPINPHEPIGINPIST